jgi:hypothetical protein
MAQSIKKKKARRRQYSIPPTCEISNPNMRIRGNTKINKSDGWWCLKFSLLEISGFAIFVKLKI